MTNRSLEQRVRHQLGFYPSYLAALEPSPAAAELVWMETERVLAGTWAPERGRWLGGAAAATIEDNLPPSLTDRLNRVTFDEPDLQRTVEFFSFVLLRLGLGISAARYALDGEALRLEHHEQAPSVKNGKAPSRWQEGPAADLPLDPRMSLIQPEAAPPHVEATFGYLTDALETPNVNTIFRAFAVDPAFLTAVVDAQVAFKENRSELDDELRGLYAAALAVDDGDAAFAAADIDEAERSMVAEQLATFQDNLATLLVTLYLGTRFVTVRQ